VTRKPVTQIVTRTEKPSTITAPVKTVTKAITQAVPTTVSIINIDEGPVTETATVPHPSPSKSEVSKKSTTTQEPAPTTDKPEPTDQSTSKFSSLNRNLNLNLNLSLNHNLSLSLNLPPLLSLLKAPRRHPLPATLTLYHPSRQSLSLLQLRAQLQTPTQPHFSP
jgi:hypothetical protein